MNRTKDQELVRRVHLRVPPKPGDAMPFKSQAQRRKFAEMMVRGEISPQTFEEWNRETGSAKLPERVTPKPRRSRPAAKKKAAKRSSTRKRSSAARRPSGRG